MQLKLNVLTLLNFTVRFMKSRVITADLLSKQFDVGMHSDVPELICFKLVLITGTAKFYILILL